MDINKLLLEAIALRKCIDATYNRTSFILAPHILYTRHGELHIDAVAIERDGQPPREMKLGTFKLAGLNVTGFSGRDFVPANLFDPKDRKDGDTTLFAVETN